MNGLAGAVLGAPDDQQKAAPLGLFVLLLLGVACYFLFRSMSRHLKRVRDEFPAGPAVVRPPVRRAPGSAESGPATRGPTAATGTGPGRTPGTGSTDTPDAPPTAD